MIQLSSRCAPERGRAEPRPVEARPPALDRCRQAGELVARALAREIR
ncbi:hypothetical protein [Caulobacter endophyticus]|nr:hypothetical protein [Caulobacter endophyticus]MDG2528003.1 hypothetical protein [Caulobacter endophyticus]